MKKMLIILIGILFLNGCASINGQSANGQIPTLIEDNLITDTPQPSNTQTPIVSFTNIKTLVQSKATISPIAYPSWDGGINRMVSPNGDYIAVVNSNGHNNIGKPVLEITDYEDNLIRQIVNNKTQLQGEPNMEITIYGWSKDCKTLYYYYKQSPVDQDIIVWWTGYALRSINVENGYDQAVIPGEGAMSFTFSPDESKIIYTLASEPAGLIHLLDFESDKNTKIYVDPAPEDFLRVGDFRWSPNGKAIIFQTEADWVEAYKEIGTVYLNAQTFEQKLLHRDEIYTYQFNGWEDDQTLRFYSVGKGHILVNIETGEECLALTGIKTPTPTITLRPTRTITPTSSLTPTITPPLPTYSYWPDTWQQGPWLTRWSPNGLFLVEVYDFYGHGDIHRPVIEIFDKNRNMLWKIPYKDEVITGGEPYVSLIFLGWSLNQRELYFYTQFHGTRGDYAVWYDGLDPSKIDLYTGEIQPLFPEGSGSISFEFADNGGRVIYSIHGNNADTVYIHNYHTGETTSVLLDLGTIPYKAIGNFHWSPNEEGVVFNTESEWVEFEGGGIFVEVQTVYLNSLTMEQKLINRSTIYEYELEDWIDNQTIRVHRVNAESRKYEVVAVNVFSEEETILPEATPEY